MDGLYWNTLLKWMLWGKHPCMVYSPTWMVDFYGLHVGKYTIAPWMRWLGYVGENKKCQTMRVLSEFAQYWCIVWVDNIMTSGGQGWKRHASKSSQFSRKVASHLALHQPKKGCKTYSLQYIYSICNISILAGLCQSCPPVLAGLLLYESLTISRCFTVSEYQSSSHSARLHATLRCNARKRRMHNFVS